jgi:hypothetical protein
VTDRRSNADTPPATPAEALRKDEAEDPDRASEQQALGISVQTLVKRILEDQHLSLRADILQSHRDFARQVAAEVIEAQRPVEPQPASEPIGSLRTPAKSRWSNIAGIVLGAALIVTTSLYWQMRESQQQLNAALQQSKTQLQLLETALQLAQQPRSTPPQNSITDSALATLTWAANRDAQVEFGEPAFNAALASRLEALIEQLTSIGFRGQIVVESHLGEFCLLSNDAGGYEPAPDDSTMLACALVGHPLDDSSFPEERQDETFTAFTQNLADEGPDGVALELIAHDRLNSTPLVAYPRSAESAGEWNQSARQNHRLAISFIPES